MSRPKALCRSFQAGGTIQCDGTAAWHATGICVHEHITERDMCDDCYSRALAGEKTCVRCLTVNGHICTMTVTAAMLLASA